jgi:hypothetical protein
MLTFETGTSRLQIRSFEPTWFLSLSSHITARPSSVSLSSCLPSYPSRRLSYTVKLKHFTYSHICYVMAFVYSRQLVSNFGEGRCSIRYLVNYETAFVWKQLLYFLVSMRAQLPLFVENSHLLSTITTQRMRSGCWYKQKYPLNVSTGIGITFQWNVAYVFALFGWDLKFCDM